MNPLFGPFIIGDFASLKAHQVCGKTCGSRGYREEGLVGKPESDLAESLSGHCLSQCKQGSLRGHSAGARSRFPTEAATIAISRVSTDCSYSEVTISSQNAAEAIRATPLLASV
jgi:hypothetical protein